MNIGFRIIHYKFSKLSRFRNMFNIQHNTGSLGDKIGKAKISPVDGKILFERKSITLSICRLILLWVNCATASSGSAQNFPFPFVNLETGITLNKYNQFFQRTCYISCTTHPRGPLPLVAFANCPC